MSFFDRREVRDVLAYLRVIQNPADEPSLRRILNQPPRGISDAVRKQLADDAIAAGELMWAHLAHPAGISGKATAAIARFRALIVELQQAAHGASMQQLVTELLARTGYRDELVRQYPDPQERESRFASLEEITNAAAAFDERRGGSLTAFLDDLTLSTRDENDEKQSQLARNAVALMTLHSAKGLEFPHVYLVGMEEGILPHKRSLEGDGLGIDEERRLCYVGVTRAQNRLTLSFALTRRKWGKPRETQPSRFLFEMTGQADNPRSPANARRRRATR